MTGALTTHVLVGLHAILVHAKDIDAFLRHVGVPVTGRWQGQAIWFRHNPDHEPWGVLVQGSSGVVAAVVLSRRRRGGLWSVAKPGGLGDPFRLAADGDEAAHALAEGMDRAMREFGGPWSLWLPDLPADDPVVEQLRELWPSSETTPGLDVPCLVFEPDRPLSDYLSRNTRNAVAKARNRIAREGLELRETCTRDPERILALLPDLMRLNRERNHQLRGHALLDDEQAAQFFTEFVEQQAAEGLLELMTIELDGELAAFALCVDDVGERWALMNVAAPSWLRYSPGTICNAEVVRRAYEDPACHRVNWGAGVQRYKVSGAATVLDRQNLAAWSSAPVRLAASMKNRVRAVLGRRRGGAEAEDTGGQTAPSAG